MVSQPVQVSDAVTIDVSLALSIVSLIAAFYAAGYATITARRADRYFTELEGLLKELEEASSGKKDETTESWRKQTL